MEETTSIIIWGTGQSSEWVYKFLLENNLNDRVIGFADNNKSLWNHSKYGLKILSPNDVINNYNQNSNLKIIIASLYLSEIKNQLINLGILENVIDIKGYGITKYFYLFNEKTPYEIINDNINQFKKVYELLEDDKSKKYM